MSILSALVLCALLGSCFFAWHVWSLFKGPNYANLRSYYPFKSEAKKKLYAEYYDSRCCGWCAVARSFSKTRDGSLYGGRLKKYGACSIERSPSQTTMPESS
jgi:hypothetical protein